jgi:hypothetical protein
MKVVNGKDFWAGVMFAAFGLAFMWKSQDYSMGTSVRMGPAYFPTVLGGLLAVLGAVILVFAFVTRVENPLKVFPFKLWRVVAGVILGVLAFYTQPGHDTNIAWQIGHTLIAGLAVGLVFAAFGERSLWIVLFSVVVFGYMLKPLGLVPAVFLMTIISALPGFEWTRKDFQWLVVYVAAAIVLTLITLAVSPWIETGVLVAFGAAGLKLPPALVLLLVEMAVGTAIAVPAAKYKWPHVTAAHVTVLSFALAVFSVASFVHGLGLPMNIWPSLWE